MFHQLARSSRSTFKPYSLTKLSFIRSKSSFILRSPPKTAPRECPTPLVFVSAKAWDAESDRGMTNLSSMLAEKGFTCLQTDLTLPDSKTQGDSASMMKWFEGELRSAVRLCMIPFPPVVFARSAGCLIAQTYISSNPASGLILISPPVSNAELGGVKTQTGLPALPTELAEFDFEPYFPIAVMATPERLKVLKGNRLVREPEVDKLVVHDPECQRAFQAIQNWLDKLGI